MSTAPRYTPVIVGRERREAVSPPDHARAPRRAIYPAGAPLFQQGEPCPYVFVVESGLVKLTQATANGRTTIVCLLGRESVIGVESATLKEPHATTATPLRDTTVLRVPAAEFESRVRANDDFAWRLHRILCRNLERSRARVASLTCLSARERLQALLEELAHELSDGGGFAMPLRDWELAQLLGITPQYLCTLTHELRDIGVLERRGDHWWCAGTTLDCNV